ncbi:tRNA (adenosine(37)-N6)-threonylcarbamoyltransferase complex dimerization subunit type 1 TsaB [Engelhardtia mirabilis]|uniref:tRNA threonylcarbamoyladenosine biosynthesis protein TsaB n=1 Tax=Engelhardtia mirabilis TaxID=2528011 RepID=A0A518BNF6_9BACT|nr:tRNA threonylcarbamoyladenosine biosynthesis protein TsaB [Planctomycetes bacterium Pla133]QDV02847.1 tRNA threonylcarbamoyladenosine biosynthesis protein TsaB [Planctomycetes bacterium Pla86]
MSGPNFGPDAGSSMGRSSDPQGGDPELLIAFETSTRAPSVAVARRGGEIHTASLEGQRAHARDLLPTLARLLESIDAKVGDVTAIGVGLGPGSFTGLRVGLATVLGLERALGVPTVGVASMAAAVFDHLAPGAVGGQLLDARGGRVYLGAFRRQGDGLATVQEVCAPKPAELRTLLAAEPWCATDPRPTLFIDDDARRAAGDALGDGESGPRVATGIAPRAEAVLRLARDELVRGTAAPAGSLRPLYLARFGE